ncbi:MAG: hypothetical protein AB7D37_04430 [Desulfovibrio sp.]
MNTDEIVFVHSFDTLAEEALANSIAHGWDDVGNDGEKIALMHSELSEALEALRQGNPQSDKIPELTSVDEELADVIIRIMIFARARKLHVAEAVVEKAIYNRTRPFKHGGKLF